MNLDFQITPAWLNAMHIANPRFDFYSTRDAGDQPSVALVWEIPWEADGQSFTCRVLINPVTTAQTVMDLADRLGQRMVLPN